MSNQIRFSIKERRCGGQRGGLAVENVSGRVLRIQAFSGGRVLEERELADRETWLIQRAIRLSKWVFLLGSASTPKYNARLLTLVASCDAGSEAWRLEANGQTYMRLPPEVSDEQSFNASHSVSDVEDGPEEPPCASDEVIVTAEGEDSSNATADVELAWADTTGKARSVYLRSVPLAQTLGEFRVCCAAALGVESVVPQDFNEDMDLMSLNALGIGLSGLPFLIDSNSPGIAMATERLGLEIAQASASLNSTAAPRSESSERHKAVKSSSRPLAEKQALQDCSEVLDGWLFLGGNLSASSLTVMRERGITHILNCCDRVPCKFKTSITYQTVSVFDTKETDIKKYFPEALDFIDTAHALGHGVLVHCMVGASRSTTFVLAWLISRRQMPLGDAFRYVRARRSVARPNRAFCGQLMEYEEAVLGRRTATLADFGHK